MHHSKTPQNSPCGDADHDHEYQAADQAPAAHKSKLQLRHGPDRWCRIRSVDSTLWLGTDHEIVEHPTAFQLMWDVCNEPPKSSVGTWPGSLSSTTGACVRVSAGLLGSKIICLFVIRILILKGYRQIQDCRWGALIPRIGEGQWFLALLVASCRPRARILLH